MGSIDTVLVVGGGIAGMCLAIGLRQRGIAVDIVELSRDWSALGVGITLHGRASTARRGGPAGPAVCWTAASRRGSASTGWHAGTFGVRLSGPRARRHD